MIILCFIFFVRSKFEAIPDNMTPDEILKQVQNAAKVASEKLATKNTKVLQRNILLEKS